MSSLLHARRRPSRRYHQVKERPHLSTLGSRELIASHRQVSVLAEEFVELLEILPGGKQRNWNFDTIPEISEAHLKMLENLYSSQEMSAIVPRGHGLRSNNQSHPRAKFMLYLRNCIHHRNIAVAGTAALFIARHGQPRFQDLDLLLKRLLSDYDIRTQAAYIIHLLLFMGRKSEDWAGGIVRWLIVYADSHCDKIESSSTSEFVQTISHKNLVIELIAAIVAKLATFGTEYNSAVAVNTFETLWRYEKRDFCIFVRILARSESIRDYFARRFELELSGAEKSLSLRAKSFYVVCSCLCDLGVLDDQLMHFLVDHIRSKCPGGSPQILAKMAKARQDMGQNTEALEAMPLWLLSAFDGRSIDPYKTIKKSPLAAAGEVKFTHLMSEEGHEVMNLLRDIAFFSAKHFVRMCELMIASLLEGRSLAPCGRAGLIYGAQMLLRNLSRFPEESVPEALSTELQDELSLFILGESDPNVFRKIDEWHSSEEVL